MLADLRRRLRLDRPRPNKAGRARAEKLDSRTAEVKALVQRFGAERLHDSYTGYALRLCDAVAASDELNLRRGRLEIWAAAVVYAVARLNFLFSDEIENHLSAAELCAWFGVKKQTAANKAARIADALELFHDDRRFCGPHVTEILHLVEDTEGFVHPAAPPGERPPPPPLKPSAWGQRQKKQVKHPPPETESAPGKKDSRQLSLFDD